MDSDPSRPGQALRLLTENFGKLEPHNQNKMEGLLQDKKLHLVLDLDRTLLSTTLLESMTSEEEYLKRRAKPDVSKGKGSLFILKKIYKDDMVTKLRPFVRKFLKVASKMYVLHIYTMGNRSYALAIVNILDPRREYIKGIIISRDDVITKKNEKTLDVIPGPESAILILDDNEKVWRKHNRNLIIMEQYNYFRSSFRKSKSKFKSYSEMKSDESATEGNLATVLKVLKKIHYMFFDESNRDKLIDRDVRQVYKSVQNEVLKGCKILFLMNFLIDNPKNHPRLWNMANRLGATCSTEYDPSVTHVVSRDFGTRGSRWAVKEKKILVHPRWLEAAYIMWKKQPEEDFPVTQTMKAYHPHFIKQMFTLLVFEEVKKLFSQNHDGFDEKMKRSYGTLLIFLSTYWFDFKLEKLGK
ncbi:RNA polymerase II C-terminal domain phosphatase-like 4 [Ziziphus jujuba]|uniref:RNA polymerase II C-terminal domain phosphatase-like n=1 Tax=Ziziphus jujuba TaxID=326968 RepID=A0A6P6FZI6_ZIZJJ|nr:RNA polymerase II C-terminal domain phosphatase-like 4 [Ziziphus jujuba]